METEVLFIPMLTNCLAMADSMDSFLLLLEIYMKEIESYSKHECFL